MSQKTKAYSLAGMYKRKDLTKRELFYAGWDSAIKATPVRPEWVSLTDEQIREIIGPYGPPEVSGYTRKLFTRIEEKLKELNT